MSLQLLAQGGDGLFQKAIFVARNAPKLLCFVGVGFGHALHFFAQFTDGGDVLLNIVMQVGGSLLEGTPFFILKAFELLSHRGDCVTQMRCLARGLMGRSLHCLLFL